MDPERKPWNTGHEVALNPGLDAGSLQGTVHTLIHTYRQFNRASPLTGMVLGGANPHKHGENMHRKSKQARVDTDSLEL